MQTQFASSKEIVGKKGLGSIAILAQLSDFQLSDGTLTLRPSFCARKSATGKQPVCRDAGVFGRAGQ